MRAESVQLQKPLQELPQQGKAPLALKKGDVINATVISQDGDSVILKSDSGHLFRAKLMLEGLLPSNTTVEMVVTSGTQGRTSVQLISIEPPVSGGAGAMSAETALLDAMGLRDNTAALEIIAHLKSMDISPTKDMIATALRLMQDASLDHKAAVFFAANQLPSTDENLKAFAALRQGQTIGFTLLEIAEEASVLDRTAVNVPQGEAAAAPRQTADPMLREPAGQPSLVVAADQPEARRDQPAAPHVGILPAEEGIPRRDGELIKGLQQAITSSADRQGSQTQETTVPAGAQIAAPEGALGIANQNEAELLWKALPSKLLNMFAKVDEALDGPAIKKAADATRELAVLKEALQSADLKGRESLAAKLSDVAAQAKLTQDINRFVCVHVPVQHQDHETAELYVYKQKKNGGGIDPENTAILIGLETEHMGRTETLIKVEKRNISLSFSIENDSAVGFVKERAKELYPALKAHNYTLVDTKVAKLVTATTPANAQETLLDAIRKPHIYIDCRV